MNLSIIGINISNYRKQKDLTQMELADKTGLSKNYISQIELGNKKPSMESFIKIANALEISSDLLLSGMIENSYNIKVSLLNDKISDLSLENQEFIYSIVDSLVDKFKHD